MESLPSSTRFVLGWAAVAIAIGGLLYLLVRWYLSLPRTSREWVEKEKPDLIVRSVRFEIVVFIVLLLGMLLLFGIDLLQGAA